MDDDPAGDLDADRAARVGDALREAFAVIGPADLPGEEKARWQQRLIAITNASKHDLATAERRLEGFWTEWEVAVGPRQPEG